MAAGASPDLDPGRSVKTSKRDQIPHALDTIDIGGHNLTSSRKYRNVAANGQVAFVVDDVPSLSPWKVRCLEIRGTAEAVEKPSDSAYGDDAPIIRVRVRRIISYGTEEQGAIPGQVQPYNRNVS